MPTTTASLSLGKECVQSTQEVYTVVDLLQDRVATFRQERSTV